MSSPPIFFNIITCALYRQMLTFTSSFTPLSSVIFSSPTPLPSADFHTKRGADLTSTLLRRALYYNFNSILNSVYRLDSVVLNIFVSDLLSIETFLLQDNGLLSDFLTSLKRLDYFVNIGSLEWVTLSIIVPIAFFKLF